MWKESVSSLLLSNAQLLLCRAFVDADLSPAINDTTGFSEKLSEQHCEVTSTHEAEYEAEIVGFQMWNIGLLITEICVL